MNPEYEGFLRKKKERDNWTAPEHSRDASAMQRDYPRDDWGHRIPGKARELKVDIRPTIMIPPRPTYKAI